ncbi:MAG: hypothetical protein PWP27_2498 [Clostridiales bacterium]|nr:hypothetical protein [Clostridiales bacterium]
MLPNLNKKLQQMMSSMDPQTLEKGFKAMSELMNTDEGKQLLDQLRNIDKQKLMDRLSAVDEKELEKKLDSIDVDEVADKINNLEKEKMLKELTNNPELMKKLNDFLNGK